MRHIHADIIHAWAEGAEVEIINEDGKWVLQNYPLFYPRDEYRVKPKEPDWWESIPEHGILVKSNCDGSISVIVPEDIEGIEDISTDVIVWTPLTNEEIERFKR